MNTHRCRTKRYVENSLKPLQQLIQHQLRDALMQHYRQTDRQTDRQTERRVKYTDYIKPNSGQQSASLSILRPGDLILCEKQKQECAWWNLLQLFVQYSLNIGGLSGRHPTKLQTYEYNAVLSTLTSDMIKVSQKIRYTFHYTPHYATGQNLRLS